jgi:hypothetical protein
VSQAPPVGSGAKPRPTTNFVHTDIKSRIENLIIIGNICDFNIELKLKNHFENLKDERESRVQNIRAYPNRG